MALQCGSPYASLSGRRGPDSGVAVGHAQLRPALLGATRSKIPCAMSAPGASMAGLIELLPGRLWPISEIDRIVRHGITHSQLKAHSPWIGQRQTRRWLKELFPDNPLICLAQETPAEMDSGFPAFAWHTRRRDSWCSRRYRLSFFSFIVPSPAKYTWGWTQDRRRSTRCNEMFPARRYLVIEWDFSLLSRDGAKETQWASWIRAWEKAGRSIQDASSALIWHLHRVRAFDSCHLEWRKKSSGLV